MTTTGTVRTSAPTPRRPTRRHGSRPPPSAARLTAPVRRLTPMHKAKSGARREHNSGTHRRTANSVASTDPRWIGPRGHGASRDRTGDLLLANSSRAPRFPMNTGTSQRLRTIASGCLRRFGNTKGNTAQPRLWKCGDDRVGAAVGSPAGRRPWERPALARIVARRRGPPSASARAGVGQGQQQAHRARRDHLAYRQRAEARPFVSDAGRRR
jgi:hypothetical protein